jgi:hypothetical protein
MLPERFSMDERIAKCSARGRTELRPRRARSPFL